MYLDYEIFIAIPFILLALYSCGESEKEDMTIEHEYSIIERFLEEYNLHPTQKENINHITGMITTNNAQYVFGQKTIMVGYANLIWLEMNCNLMNFLS